MTDNTTTSRRRFLQATGGAASAAAIAGCLGGGGDDGDDGGDGGDGGDRPQQDKRFRRINSTMSTLDPVAATDTASGVVIQQMMDALTNYPNGEIETENLIASGVDVSDDNTTYTFNLKEDVQFHNGDEVTAEDFIYSFERLAGSPNSSRAYFIRSSLGVIHETNEVEVETEDGTETQVRYAPQSLALNAPDEKTLEMELSEPFHSVMEMLAYTSFAVVPAGSMGDIPGWDADSPPEYYSSDEIDSETYEAKSRSEPVGSGPFEFNEWSEEDRASVDRFDDYHGPTAIVAGVDWAVITGENARFQHAQEYNSDEVAMPTSQYTSSKLTVEETDDKGRDVGTYGPMQNGETANWLGVPTINSFYIGMNTSIEENARKAVAHALHQEQISQQIFKGRVSAGYHFTPPGIFPGGASGYDEHASNNYPYSYQESNLDAAQQLMEDAGYGPNNTYEFTFTYYASGASTWGAMGERLRDQLASAHIEMQLEEAPFSTLLSRGRQGQLEAYSLGWIMDWPAPDNFLQNAHPPKTDTSQEGGATGLYIDWNEGDGRQDAIDAWETIQNNRGPTDEAEQARQDAYITMEEAMWEDMVLLPVYHRTDERFLYEWVDWDKFGFGGTSRAKCHNVEIGDRPSSAQ